MARRESGKFLSGPLSSEFITPRKISNMNKIFSEKMPHLHLYSGSQFRKRGGKHLQTGNCERDAWNMNRASERGTRRGTLALFLIFCSLKVTMGRNKGLHPNKYSR